MIKPLTDRENFIVASVIMVVSNEMKKVDRQELDKRLEELEYYRGLALRMCIEQGVKSKREVLAQLRLEETVEYI